MEDSNVKLELYEDMIFDIHLFERYYPFLYKPTYMQD